MVRFARICIASTGGGGGKTLLSIGLAGALTVRGYTIKPFKKGPDYIDATWLAQAAGIPTTNLDPFFLDASALKSLFERTMDALASRTGNNAVLKSPIALIEGNRGLYDGLDETGSCSTAYVARVLQAPLLLCLNCTKSTRTMAAILKGLTTFEQGLNFCGVVLNRIGSARHETSLRRAIEACLDIPVLGALPRLERNPLPERHMGLACQGGNADEHAEAAIEILARHVAENCDIEAIGLAAAAAPAMEHSPQIVAGVSKTASLPKAVRIGYVRDAALWFHYPENLEALQAAGGELIRLSLVKNGDDNRRAWDYISALYLGGGFPEDHARDIGQSPILTKIYEFAQAGMPIYAECGGLIVLCRALERAGEMFPMCGIFSCLAKWHSRPQGLGYVEGEIVAENPFFPVGLKLRGHEFHYSSCIFEKKPRLALRLERGSGLCGEPGGFGLDGLIHKNVWAAYTHIFAPAVPCWATNFVRAASMRGDAAIVAEN